MSLGVGELSCLRVANVPHETMHTCIREQTLLKIDACHAARLLSRVKVGRKMALNGIIFLSVSVIYQYGWQIIVNS